MSYLRWKVITCFIPFLTNVSKCIKDKNKSLEVLILSFPGYLFCQRKSIKYIFNIQTACAFWEN